MKKLKSLFRSTPKPEGEGIKPRGVKETIVPQDYIRNCNGFSDVEHPDLKPLPYISTAKIQKEWKATF